MTERTSELRIANPDRPVRDVSGYREKGRIQLRDILDAASANAIHESLRTHKKWNLVYAFDGKHMAGSESAILQWPAAQRRKLEKAIHMQAAQGFQYYFASIPIYEIYHERLLPGHFFNELFEFLNADEVISLVRTVTGDDTIDFADAQATRFGPGHFLTSHDDDLAGKNRRAAYVLNLTPVWRQDWGGALQFYNSEGNIAEAYMPGFNLLTLFRVPADHSVGIVAPFATASRYSITGWFRSGQDPAISE